MQTKELSLYEFMVMHGACGKIDWDGLFCIEDNIPAIVFTCDKCKAIYFKVINSKIFYEWLQEHQLHGGKWYITTNPADKSVSFDYICRCNERYCVKTN